MKRKLVWMLWVAAVLGLVLTGCGQQRTQASYIGADAAKAIALDAAGISVVRRWVETLVPCPYSLLELLKSETAAWGGVIPETEYGADVTLTVLLPEEKAEAYLAHILDMTAGTVEGIATGERFQDVPWRPAGGAGGPG